MAELQAAPELVDPAPTDAPNDAPADPAPVDGQQTETPTDATPPQSFHIGDADYSMDELTEHLERSNNASAMHKSAHEKNTAANEALEKALAIQNDGELQELRTILKAIQRDGGMSQEYDALRRSGGPMAMEVRMGQMESRIGALSQQKGELEADDILGQFAAKHDGMTKEQAEEVGRKFLADTKAEQFPEGADMLDQLEYFHWKNYGQQGQTDALAAATKTGYDDAIGRVKAGQEAELGSPATQSEVPWEPPKDAPDNMLASELAALADDGIVFDNDPFS